MGENRFQVRRESSNELSFEPGLVLGEDGTLILIAPGGDRFDLTALARRAESPEVEATSFGMQFEGAPEDEQRSKIIGAMPAAGRVELVSYLPFGVQSMADLTGRGFRLVRDQDNATIFDSAYYHDVRPYPSPAPETMPAHELYGFYPNEDVRNDLAAGTVLRWDSYPLPFYIKREGTGGFPYDFIGRSVYDRAVTPRAGALVAISSDPAGLDIDEIRASTEDADGADRSAALAAFTGYVRLFGRDNPSNWIIADVTSVTSHTGYKKINVTPELYSRNFEVFNSDDEVMIEHTAASPLVENPTAAADPGGIVTIRAAPTG